MRRATCGAIIAGLSTLLAGCASTAPASGPSTATVTVTASASASASSTAPPTASAPSSASPSSTGLRSTVPVARSDPDAPRGQCADSALRVDLRQTGGGLGSRQDLIVLTNTGSTTCALAGAPGVSVVGDGNGTQLGRPAGRAPGAARVLRLDPGGTVTAELDRVFVDGRTTTFRTDDGQVACRPKRGDGYRVYPPHSFRAVFLRRPDVWACTSGFVWMHVAAVVTGK